MTNKEKGILGLVIAGAVLLLALIGFFMITENIEPGYVGYVYDRTIDPDSPEDNVVPVLQGTSVIDKPRYGLVFLNPFTQEMYISPTTVVSRSWTRTNQEGSNQDDSIAAGTIESKNVPVDIYLSVQPSDVGKIIKNWGVDRSFESIVDDELYGVMKGEVKKVTRKVSVYNFQAKVEAMQKEIFENLDKVLQTRYGIKLVRFEFGNVHIPQDILEEIEKKTKAINEVELAELDAKRQAEVNAKEVAKQEAESKQELIKRKAETDAAAYEKERDAKAKALARKQEADAEAYAIRKKAQAQKDAAKDKLEAAKLEKEAELQRQMAFTDKYFADRELDLQTDAVKSINDKLEIIVAPEGGNGIGSIPGTLSILDKINKGIK